MGKDFFERYPFEVREPLPLLRLTEDSKYLSEKLRWVSLQGFSSEYLPNDFYLHDAIAIDVKHSLLRFLWKKPQVIFTCRFLLKLLFVFTYNYFVFSFPSLIFYQKLSS